MSAIKSIEIKLKTKLDPSHLEVINESHLHSVEPGRESHVRIVAVSDKFESLNLVKRHQLIYEILSKVMKEIHALSIQAFTLEEYKNNPVIFSSPDCANKKS